MIERTRRENNPFPDAIEECTVKAAGTLTSARSLYDCLLTYFLAIREKRYMNASDKTLAAGIKRVLGKDSAIKGADGRMYYKGIRLRR